jgi:hypothetical protein
MFLLSLFSLLICLLIEKSQETCAFTQTCSNRADLSTCSVPVKKTFEPTVQSYATASVCPEFYGSPSCCNEDQNALLANSFNIIKYTFGYGENGGGCDICGINLYRFWCHFTCNPNQADFVHPEDYINVTDPTDSSKTLYVLNLTMYVNPNTACQLFGSCQKTPYVSQVSAMQTAEGLMSFLGNNAVTEGQEKINIIYSDDPKDHGLNLSLHKCNETFYKNDSFGYPVLGNCTCNNCNDACPVGALEFLKDAEPMEGFDWVIIVIMYACAIGATILCIIYRRMEKNHRRESQVSETNLMDN